MAHLIIVFCRRVIQDKLLYHHPTQQENEPISQAKKPNPNVALLSDGLFIPSAPFMCRG